MSSDISIESRARATWHQFCDALKEAGDLLIEPGVPQDEQTQADGLRYLSRMARAALEWYVEFNDPAFPVLYRPAHETIKLGADNPDNLYQKAVIDGRYEYLLKGTRGSVDYISMATSRGSYAENFTQVETGFLDGNTLAVGADGTFEVVISQKQQTGNWLTVSEASESLLIRQTFRHRDKETPAEITIERLDRYATPEPLELMTAIAHFEKATAFYRNTTRMFADWSQKISQHPNTLPLWDQAFCQMVGGDPNILYYHGHFKLHNEEAMVITLPSIPACQTWNIQVDNYWMESLDYRYHRVSLNQAQASVNDNGSVTLILTATDPNCDNWISTAGHGEGTLCFRWVGAKDSVDPQVAVMPVGDIGNLKNLETSSI
ncbi:MAG: DUF1214 domain-containing protein [Luminiphilus sp.]|jgi:hypothetical protein|nr:DUF1214 domain-containing protein [Luminiphilus sp.]